MGTLNLIFFFGLDADFKCLDDFCVYIVEANTDFDVEFLNYARGHLSNFLVDLNEVEIYYECTFRILQPHLFKLFKHYSNHQIIRLVNLE